MLCTRLTSSTRNSRAAMPALAFDFLCSVFKKHHSERTQPLRGWRCGPTFGRQPQHLASATGLPSRPSCGGSGAASQSTGSSGGCQAKPAHHLRGPGPCEAGGTLTGAGRARAPVSRFPPARLIWPGKGQTSLAPRASGPKACPFRPQIHRQSGQTSPPRGHLGSRFVRSSRRSTPVTPRGHERTWEEGDSDGATERRSRSDGARK